MVRVPLKPPPTLRRSGGVAEAIIAFVVDTSGMPRDVHAISSSDPDFAEAAEDAVRQWRFKSGYKDGEPVNTSMQMPMTYQGN